MLDRTPIRGAAVALLLVAAAAPACVTEDDASTEPAEPATVYLSPTDHLVRVSMALRGIRPSIADLNMVRNDPSQVEALVDVYLDTPEFGRTVRDIYAEAFLTRTDYFIFPAGFPAVGTLEGTDPYYLNTSLQESAPRLVEHVVMNDRPFTEIVTADYQVVNAVGARAWGLSDYDFGGEEWQRAHFDDGRPTAGVLSDPFLFTRHASTYSNANRGRANAISKALLCYDFLSRDIELDANIDLADPDVVANAVVDNGACASCHQTLDPFASFFRDYFPLYVAGQLEETVQDILQDDQAQAYPFYMFNTRNVLPDGDFFELNGVELREPAYFGQPGETIADLGHLMAQDPRMSLCATQRFYGYFHQLPAEEVPLFDTARLQESFIASGYDAKALAKAIVLSDGFRAAYHNDEQLAEQATIFKVRPDQLSPMIRDLTGFVWNTHLVFPGEAGGMIDLGQVDLTTDSFLGYEVLGGGIDGQYVTRAAHTFNASSSLALQTLAAEAAAFVVERDFAVETTKRHLLWVVEPEDTDEAKLRDQLSWLHARLYGEILDNDAVEVDETLDLFLAALAVAEGDGHRAWETTLTAMLQDHRVVTY
ncbi:MAG TPA: hypothetical protein ENK57_01900 [Polyangiaceae bacterium]|nr:hypothetical protein [Polyangiaceae bacterium]